MNRMYIPFWILASAETLPSIRPFKRANEEENTFSVGNTNEPNVDHS